MTSWAKVGAKCVCVDNGPSLHGECSLVLGRTYVITQRLETDFGVGINVGGVVSKALGFHVWRFRPLITKTQSEDVALFLELLETQGEDA